MISTMFLVRVSFVLAVVGFKSSFAEEIPSFVVQCKSDDQACLKRQGQSLVSALVNGYPALSLENLDPYTFKSLDLSTGGLKLVSQDLTFTGLGGAKVDNFQIDSAAKEIVFKYNVPVLDGKGKYKAGGQLVVLPIEGEGDADVSINNMKIDMKFPFELINKDGKEHVNVKTVKYNYEIIDNVRFNFENLFNGNKQLSEVTHKFMNEQWKEVSDQLAPPIVKVLFKKVTENMKKIFAAVPLDKFVQA